MEQKTRPSTIILVIMTGLLLALGLPPLIQEKTANHEKALSLHNAIKETIDGNIKTINSRLERLEKVAASIDSENLNDFNEIHKEIITLSAGLIEKYTLAEEDWKKYPPHFLFETNKTNRNDLAHRILELEDIFIRFRDLTGLVLAKFGTEGS